MYYVISKSTDLRCPNTEVKKFTNLRNEELSSHIYKHIYQLTGRINKKDKISKNTPIYTHLDLRDKLIRRIRYLKIPVLLFILEDSLIILRII